MENNDSGDTVHIITGAVNSGKTTELRRRIEKYRNLGKKAGGIITEAESKDGIKSVFFVRRIGGRERVPIAIRKDLNPRNTRNTLEATGDGEKSKGTEGFDFYQEGFETAALWIYEACSEEVDLLCIDELGPVELRGEGHWPALVEAAGIFRGILELVVRKGLVEDFTGKFIKMGKRVEVVEVQPDDAGV
ncbi:MAG: nucleoside-triphosphatase [Spirochaetia bacterium]